MVEQLHFDEVVQVDPLKPFIASAWGRKGSGKSVWSRHLYDSWPWDKVCIDVNGNADPGPDAERVPTPIPTQFPDVSPGLGQRRRQRNLHYRADPGSATYRDDLDRAVGLALRPQDHRCLLWAGEVGELMANGKPGPHMRTVLMQNRHFGMSALFDGPRPVYVDPLVLSQSDLVAIYHLPNPADRERIANEIGTGAKAFHQLCHDTWREGKHWFLLWIADAHELVACPPLPVGDEA